jgi:hypothetical protein
MLLSPHDPILPCISAPALLLALALGCGARTGLPTSDVTDEADDAGSTTVQNGDAAFATDSRPAGLPPCRSYTTVESCARGGCASCLIGSNGLTILLCFDIHGVGSFGGGQCGSP